MKIFILLFLIIIVFIVIFSDIFTSAKRNLFKDQAAWSGKDLKIKYRSSKEISQSSENDNYLKIIADESKNYLEDESKRKDDEI